MSRTLCAPARCRSAGDCRLGRGAEDEQVVDLRPRAQALFLELLRLRLEKEGAAGSNVAREVLWGDFGGVDLRVDRGLLAVIEQITGPQLEAARRVQGQRGPLVLHEDGLLHAPDCPALFLLNDAGVLESVQEAGGRAVQSGWFRGVELDIAIIDAHAAQGGEHMLHEADLQVAVAQRGAAMRAGDIVDMRGHPGLRSQIDAHEYDPGADGGRPKTDVHRFARDVANALHFRGAGDGSLIAIAELFHVGTFHGKLRRPGDSRRDQRTACPYERAAGSNGYFWTDVGMAGTPPGAAALPADR